MTQVGPLMVAARSKEHAEYVIRSRAEQRGVPIDSLDVGAGNGGMWAVTVMCDEKVDPAQAGQLADDTQVLHLHNHPQR